MNTHFDVVRQLLNFRSMMDGFGARCASMRIADDPALMDGLNTILKELTAAARRGDYPSFQRADQQLHEAIMEASGVPGLTAAWKIIWEKMAEHHNRSFYENVSDSRIFIDEHKYLVEMLESGDPAAAEDAARSHIEASWARMTSWARAREGRHDPLYMASTYMKAYMHYPLRLEHVAAKIAYTSAGNLSRLFRQRYGMGFQAWLQGQRMEKAAELLAGTGLSVAAIAHRVGYRNLSRFALHFSRYHHQLPAKWRKKKKSEIQSKSSK